MLLRKPSVCKRWLIFFCLLLIFYNATHAQYFGRNKVNYTKLDFKVLQSPNFELYHYLKNTNTRNRFIQSTEQWYRMHQSVLRDTFTQRNPFLLYNSHAEFQQTRAIEGLIGVGTGGVTEALKNRVIMPFMESNAQTDHVLGHELVHAFQYHLILDSLSLKALSNLPLWMVEGLAEYMSIGTTDAHTAIWLRSAVAANKLPTLKDLTNRPDLYFPYRWGEAFWAYTTGLWGDTVIRRLFVETARLGYEDALKKVLKIDAKTFSQRWQEALRTAYAPYRSTTSLSPTGNQVISQKNAGEMNVAPSISPDGRRIAFWTEKNLFNIDLYVADAETGRDLKKITSTRFASHIDEYSSYESAVAWSPDSRRLAFVAFAKGRNRLIIADAQRGKILQEIDVPGVPAISNPTWSPDGNTIVMTGLVDGQSDLYAYDLNKGQVRQLTNDRYADIHPNFSPDGKYIVFATDRLSMGNKQVHHHYAHNIALINLQTKEINNLSFFSGANNLNPVFGSDHNIIYFLSDRDGFRNLYSYNIQSGNLSQLTNLFTGITGITLYSPAISASRQGDKIVYNYYTQDAYAVYTVRAGQLQGKNVNPQEINMQAAILPPFNRLGIDMVQRNLIEAPFELMSAASLKEVPFKPKFQLDYLGNTGVGVSTSRGIGTGLAGGVNGIFSDVLGNNQLFGAIALNGEIYDLGAQFAYLNQSKRINWGASVSHVPYLSGAQYLMYDSLRLKNGDSIRVINSAIDLLRTFEDQVSLFASYPFSQTRRFEAGGSFARYYYRLDRYSEYFSDDGLYYVGSKREKLETPSGFNLGQAYVAFVGDNSHFGVASPLAGHRFRFEVGQYLGAINLQTTLGDYRKYFRMAPFTLATRQMYMGRFGKDAESGVIPPLYIGYPFFIRGYEALGYAQNSTAGSLSINDLIGKSIYVSNVELRYPLSGPERLSGIKSRFFLSELNLFTDGGVAWGNRQVLQDNTEKQATLVGRTSRFVLSSGVSLRVNLFGYLIIEPYYAIPWQNGGVRNASFGLNFIPGW